MTGSEAYNQGRDDALHNRDPQDDSAEYLEGYDDAMDEVERRIWRVQLLPEGKTLAPIKGQHR